MSNNLRIGLIKHVPEKWNLEKNLGMFEIFCERAAERGVSLLTTCECYLDGYCVTDNPLPREKFIGIAQDIDKSEYISSVRTLAKKYRMHIVFGFSQKTDAGVKNAALLIGKSGEDIGIYHKTHLLTHDLNFLPGEDLPVFDTELGKIGIMICADRRWPETARTLKLKGAELIINPTYGMHHEANEWWMRTRSYENEIYIAFAHPNVGFICNPHGNIEAKLESNLPDILVHDIDLSKTVNTMLPARRPELYGIIGR